MMTRHALVPAYLVACLLLGGASAAGYIANLFLQLAALPIIGWALWSLPKEPRGGPDRSLLLLLALFLFTMILQLVPLPPVLWTALPGREPVVAGYRLLGTALPWQPLSLTPEATLASMLWLLPAIAVLLGIMVLGAFRGRWIIWAILSVTALSVALGAVQVVGGRDGGGYIYSFSNWGQAVGFFANSNHTATLLLVAIPFLAALQSSLLRRNRSSRNVSAVRMLVWASYIVIAIGLLTNFSLAGLGLSIPVAMVSVFAFGTRKWKLRPAFLITSLGLSVAAVTIVLIGPFQNNLFGQQQAHAELSRQTSFRLTLQAAEEYLPLGSGVGSFRSIYYTQEPLNSVSTTFMNHAHSDWLEILLETGAIGFGLALLFVFWWLRRVRALWRADEPDHLSRAAAIATGTIMVHSLVDYPLRTAALSAVFAMGVALMTNVRPFARRSTRSVDARHLTL